MDFSFEHTDTRFTACGPLGEVQKRLETMSPELGFMTLGAALAMVTGGQRRVCFPFSENPAVDQAPFEVTVHVTPEGEPARVEFRFLEGVPAHG